MKYIILIAIVLVSAVAAQNCTSIIHAGKSKNKNLFPTAGFPEKTATLPPSACGLPAAAQVCEYQELFSCLSFSYETYLFSPVDCAAAQKADDFPICYGDVAFYSNCTTFSCCQDLNSGVLPYVKQHIGLPRDTSFYYYMQFYSPLGTSIGCQSFSEGYDTCIQRINFKGSSNWVPCDTFYRNFQSADAMAFDLF